MRDEKALSHTNVFCVSSSPKPCQVNYIPESCIALWEEQKGNMANSIFGDGCDTITYTQCSS